METCTGIIQCAAAEVAAVPLWLKIALPILGLLLRHLFPQSGDWLNRILQYIPLINPTPEPSPDVPDDENEFDLRKKIIAIIEGLFARREKALAAGDAECVEQCSRDIDKFSEMLKGGK